MKKILLLTFIIALVLISQITSRHVCAFNGIAVLGYHNIVSDEEKKTIYKDDIYAISESVFRSHLDYLSHHHYRTLSLDEFDDWYEGRTGIDDQCVVLTFDDGYRSVNDIVKPLLKRYHMQGSAFVIGRHLDDRRPEFLKLSDIKDNGTIKYYSHSYDLHHHVRGTKKPLISSLDQRDFAKDFNQGDVDHRYMAYPYGAANKRLMNVLQENEVGLAFSYNQFHHATKRDARYLLPRYMIVDKLPQWYLPLILS